MPSTTSTRPSPLPGAEVGGNIEYSFLRDLRVGPPKETQNNKADFISVEPHAIATSIGSRSRQGQGGPEAVAPAADPRAK